MASVLAMALILGAAIITDPAAAVAPQIPPASRGSTTPLDRDSNAYRETRTLLPSRFWVHETRRYVILSDADAATTRQQGAWLEQVHTQFHRFARTLGVKPQPLRHKLVCVLFSDRGSYQAFARENDDATAAWIAGYFAPAADRIVFYDVEAGEGLADVRSALRSMQDEVRHLRTQAHAAAGAGRPRQAELITQTARDYQAHLDREQDRIDRFADGLRVATTTHEATHQLMFHTGLQSSHVSYPLWISEGLATCFETGDASLPFGPDREQTPRREEFFLLLNSRSLMPLADLLALTDLPDHDEELVRCVYHQSYALVTWMYRFRRTELHEFLRLMNLEPPGHPSPERHLKTFTRAFGSIDRLERAWLRHEHRLLAERGELPALADGSVSR